MPSLKKCTKCGTEKPADTQYFPRRTNGSNDGLASWCRNCSKVATDLWRSSPEAKERDRSGARNRRARYREIREASRPQRAVKLERKSENLAKKREYQNRANRKRRATPEGKINSRISARVRECLKYSEGTKVARWEVLVGYSLDELKRHIQKQFQKGMSWENIGYWHIDHILPLSSFHFNATDDPEFRSAWTLTNLRPLWASENIKKHARRTLLI